MDRNDLKTKGWSDYELLDAGHNKKLERFGDVMLIRPETQALWKPRNPALWGSASAEFVHAGGQGKWVEKKNVPEQWNVQWKDMTLVARCTGFKHVGIFPEQEPNWEWIETRVRALAKPLVLNLFAYTGAASIVAARAGAFVTHVDASKQSIEWAKENAAVSGLSADVIRWMLDDALKFAKREVRRGSKYQGIILDPPAFGRGAKGEVWKIEESLADLVETTKEAFDDAPGSFYLLNGYAAGYSAESFRELIERTFAPQSGEYGELGIEGSGILVASGMYARFAR